MEVYLHDPYACVHSGNFTFLLFFIYYNIQEEDKDFLLRVTADARVQSGQSTWDLWWTK